MVTHLACIMDGNRRWAKKQGWLPWKGHRQGAQTIQLVVDYCIKKNISHLSLYTFSTENLVNRSDIEKKFLFELMAGEAKNSIPRFTDVGVRVRFVGDRSLFPKEVAQVCDTVEQATVQGSVLQLNFLFCYGGRQELISGITSLVKKAQEQKITADDVTEELLQEHLWLSDTPDPDLIIRTGGYKRLSNFLLFQAAYAELYFLDCLWPALKESDLDNAFAVFNSVKRNFGS